MALTQAERREVRELQTRLRALKAQRDAEAIKRGKTAKRDRAKAIRGDAGQRDPRQREADYETWLHEWDCIACLIEGGGSGPIESAHQKLAIASKGWREGGLGPRIHDARSVPLCAHHHRLAPNSCDTGGQRKFWDRLGLGDLIADFCCDLHAAFRADALGADVIAKYVRIALTNLSEADAPKDNRKVRA